MKNTVMKEAPNPWKVCKEEDIGKEEDVGHATKCMGNQLQALVRD